MNTVPWLTLLIAVPWAGALLLAVFPRLSPGASRALALAFSLSTLALAVPVASSFDAAWTGLQQVEQARWIAALNADYHVGIDGMGLLMVLLTGIVGPAALLASRDEGRNPRLMGLLFLMLQGSALGVFLAQDFLLWFVFWELSLVPSFFLIKLWGGEGRAGAAYQFVVYTIAGSAFMLLAFAAVFAATGTLSFPVLAAVAGSGALDLQLGGMAPWVFLGVLLGLAVKVPLFPLHTWLPSAYAEAPTGASMFLTGVLSKMGVYGVLRILIPLFPVQAAAAAPVLLGLAVAGALAGAFAALVQTDLKRMIAYSSINHVSYCLVAVFATLAGAGSPEAGAAALSGALLQMFNHGLSAPALFLCAGVLEARAGGRRGLGDFGGVRTQAPLFAGLCGVALFSSLGLPGLNGFVGEFLIFRGVFGEVPWAAALAAPALLATALFLLTFYQRVFCGPVAGGGRGFRDLEGPERIGLGVLSVLMIVFGLLPHLLAGFINPLVNAWLGGPFAP